ncbi:MAG TPA: diacylglycerol kinase family protein [Verrucomicrobiae bacterium]|nr:diacylglycerol kinase family protein [Verrucomicrobiae bacterium]
MRTCVIFNPTARGDKARHFRRHLDEIGADATLMQTTGPGAARTLAQEAVAAGFEVVVAAGGDGTVNEVLNGIGDVPDGFARAALGVLPLGTVNVFARELKIPRGLTQAWQTIQGQRRLCIDLPCAEFTSGSRRVTRHFAQLAGAGLDARAIELVHWPLKKKIGPLAYVVAGIHALRQRQASLVWNDGKRSISGELILVGNGRLYGGGFALFPEADLGDALLEVSIFPKVNWMVLARCGPSLLLKRRVPPGVIINVRESSFSIECTGKAAVELDGELAGHLPAKFSIARRRLQVVVPEWVLHPISVRTLLDKV